MLLLLLPPLLLGGCASERPLDTSQVDRSLTPAVASGDLHHVAGKQVLWGGIILQITNLSHSTLIEMRAYPLDSRQIPQRDASPLGRFLVEQDGFLDPAVYATGRLLTATGTIVRIQTGRIGEAEQTSPVVKARELHLWPKDNMGEEPVMFFGIGVGFDL